MNFIYIPNGKDEQYWFDGQNIHPLRHPDEVHALNMAYEQCYGKSMPSFYFGDANSPWATRFEDAVRRIQP